MNPASPSTHHCGRLTPHPAHAWQTPAGHRRIRPVLYCKGVVIIEGGNPAAGGDAA